MMHEVFKVTLPKTDLNEAILTLLRELLPLVKVDTEWEYDEDED